MNRRLVRRVPEVPAAYRMPLEPTRFEQAWKAVNEAMIGPPLWPEGQAPRVTIQGETGELETLAFGDHPVNRMLFTLKRLYPEDGLWESAFDRMQELVRLLKAGLLDPWVRRHEGRQWLHSCVLEAVALMPLTRAGTFRREDLLQEIRRRWEAADDRDGP